MGVKLMWATTLFDAHAMLRAILLAICVATTTIVPAAAEDESALWRAVARGEAFAMMRHALAPGTGDPANFRINDCTTQRNLSERGRQQARNIGARFKANGIEAARVMTSQWCRCRDTAAELGLGTPEDLPALNSFFEDRDRGPAQTAALRAWLAENREDARPLVLVSHFVNVRALTGTFMSSGETVVARLNDAGGVEVLGTLPTDRE